MLFISAGDLIIQMTLRAISEISKENKSSSLPVDTKGPLLGFVAVFKFPAGERPAPRGLVTFY